MSIFLKIGSCSALGKTRVMVWLVVAGLDLFFPSLLASVTLVMGGAFINTRSVENVNHG